MLSIKPLFTISKPFKCVTSKRYAGSLVIGDVSNDCLTKNTLSAIEVAKQFGDISLWLCDLNLDETKCIEYIKSTPVKELIVSNIKSLSCKLPENRTKALQLLQKQHKFDFICGCSSSQTKSLLARLSGVLNVPMLTDVINVLDKTTFQRFVYAGNALETVKVSNSPLIMTIRTSSHIVPQSCPSSQSSSPQCISLNIEEDKKYATLIKENHIVSDRPELTTASRVVVGGRGVGSKEKFEEINALADKLKAAVGGTRAAVDMNMLDASFQVGQTGKVISPSLYIGCGVSGSIQHQAGMKESQTIVCINKDPEAPLFNIADFGIVGDMHSIIPEIVSKL